MYVCMYVDLLILARASQQSAMVTAICVCVYVCVYVRVCVCRLADLGKGLAVVNHSDCNICMYVDYS